MKLYFAADRGDITSARSALEAGADVNYERRVSQCIHMYSTSIDTRVGGYETRYTQI